MKLCKECKYIGDYTTRSYVRNPHYCCELIWQLYGEDYKVDPEKLEDRCPLLNIDLNVLRDDFINKIWREIKQVCPICGKNIYVHKRGNNFACVDINCPLGHGAKELIDSINVILNMIT